jgi:hypothetical protein
MTIDYERLQVAEMRYRSAFGEPPPTFTLRENEIIPAIEKALETGEPMKAEDVELLREIGRGTDV